MENQNNRKFIMGKIENKINRMILNHSVPIIDKIVEIQQAISARCDEQEKRTADIEEREGWTRNRFEEIEDHEEWTRERFEDQDKRFEGIESREEWTRNRFEEQDKRFQGIEEREEWTRNRFEEHQNRFDYILERLNTMHNMNNNFEDSFYNKMTYSQSGEDSIVAYILNFLGVQQEKITYLDLGANHARDMSNTYYFYSIGAKGVLVEANPQLIEELETNRPRDIVLNKCVTDHSGDFVKFYIMSGDGLSTPDFNAAKQFIERNPELKIMNEVKVKTISVNDILELYFHEPPTILNIDIEGKELDILNSINFEKYRPEIVIIEMIPYDKKLVVGQKNEKIMKFMETKRYVEYACTGINSIFLDMNVIL